jgi:hypothetical protein
MLHLLQSLVFWYVTEASKTLPPRKSYRPFVHRAIQRLYSGRNLNRLRKRETRNQKTDLPRRVYLTIQLSDYNPSLRGGESMEARIHPL